MNNLEEKIKEIQDIVRHARHMHVAMADPDYGPDTCKVCGYDLRHSIHYREGDEDKEYEGYNAAKQILNLLSKLEIECPECGGSGEVEVEDQSEWIGGATQYNSCPKCRIKLGIPGTGKILLPISKAIDKVGKVVL